MALSKERLEARRRRYWKKTKAELIEIMMLWEGVSREELEEARQSVIDGIFAWSKGNLSGVEWINFDKHLWKAVKNLKKPG